MSAAAVASCARGETFQNEIPAWIDSASPAHLRAQLGYFTAFLLSLAVDSDEAAHISEVDAANQDFHGFSYELIGSPEIQAMFSQ